MAYKIVITHVDKGVTYESQRWQKLRDDEEKDPTGKNEAYGYVTTEETKDVESKVFEQQVDELNLSSVVAVINNITVKE